MDLQGSNIPGVYVSVFSGLDKCEVVTKADGLFDCKLPAGEFRVFARTPNILPYRRAGVTISPRGHAFITIRPVFVAPSDQYTITDPKLRYSTWRLPTGLEVEVQFESSATAGDEVVYSGSDVTLTADTLSVRAREIRCSSSAACVARGNVIVDLGSETVRGSEVDLDLAGRRFVLTQEPVVTREF